MTTQSVHVLHCREHATPERKETVEKLRRAFCASADTTKTRVRVVTELDACAVPRDAIPHLTDISAQGLASPFDRLVDAMHVNQLSNALKHYAALRSICSSPAIAGDDDAHLVVEDDVMFDEAHAKRDVDAAVRNAPPGWDVLFLGLPKAADGKSLERGYHPAGSVYRALPACDSYLITRAAAERLAARFLPVRFATNVHLSWLLLSRPPPRPSEKEEGNGKGFATYIAAPHIFLDGSKYGTTLSKLNVNNRLIWNPWYMRMYPLVRGADVGSSTDAATVATIDALYGDMQHRSHPDARYLHALALAKRGAHREAADEMAATLSALEERGHSSSLNRSSEFLNAYCDIHKFLQQHEHNSLDGV